MMKSLLHYDILEKLGEGGMGIVYRAHDTKLNRYVALKFLPHHISSDPIERQRFKQEAQAAALINHTNVAQVYAIEEHENELFIVMEYVEGRELKELLKNETLDREQKVEIAHQVALALEAAHEKNVIHRDIKSGNIMIDESGQVKVMDFGLAHIHGADHITKKGTTVGTTAYMSPEQLSGEEVDFRSDIWAYGVVLYELFTGNLPFSGAYEAAIMYSIAQEAPDKIPDSESIPAAIHQVIFDCLSKNREERLQNMQQVLEVLEGVGNNRQKTAAIAGNSQKILTTRSALLSGGVVVFTLLVILFFNPGKYLGLNNALPAKKHLAVLPIENIGDNPAMKAICDGLAETFSYKLSELERFESSYWVTPASEIRREKIASAKQANAKFGVNLAILSSIQTFSDSARVILELVDADNLRRLGTESVVVSAKNLAQLEQESVRAMLKMLDIQINPNIAKVLQEGEPSRPEAYEYYLKGRASLQSSTNMDSLESAARFFEQSIEVDPEYALAYAGLGEARWRKFEVAGDTVFVSEAKNALNKAINLNNDLAPVQAMLGTVLAGSGAYERAEYHYNRAIEIDPKYSTAYRGLAKVYNTKGDAEEAIKTYEKAIELKPDYWEGYKDLGVHYLRQGDFEQAINQLDKVVEITPRSSGAYSNLGAAYYYNGQIEEARAMFERALALEKNPLTANNLAGIYYWEGRYAEAANMYEIALESYDNRYEIWGNLAAAYDLSNQNKKSRQAYLKAIEKAQQQFAVNTENATVLADLGAYYSDVADTANAIEFITRALELSPQDIMVRQRAVSTYEKIGQRSEALLWINAAMISDIEQQPELELLREDADYQKLKEQLINDK